MLTETPLNTNNAEIFTIVTFLYFFNKTNVKFTIGKYNNRVITFNDF